MMKKEKRRFADDLSLNKRVTAARVILTIIKRLVDELNRRGREIEGEREQGTLRLHLANAVVRFFFILFDLRERTETKRTSRNPAAASLTRRETRKTTCDRNNTSPWQRQPQSPKREGWGGLSLHHQSSAHCQRSRSSLAERNYKLPMEKKTLKYGGETSKL